MRSHEFDKRTALFLASVCKQTYTQFENDEGTFIVPHAYKIVKSFSADFFERKERFGFILESEDRAVVAFRGTVSAVDWIADAVARQKKYRHVRNAGWTHEGFTEIYDSLRKPILSALSSLPAHKKLYVTGHSLGGALATLCAIDAAANSKYRSPLVYTFGAPRVGDPAFVKAFDGSINGCHRVYNVYDLVPQLPPLMYTSPKTGAVYQYMHVKNGYPLQFRNGSVSANHVLGSYFRELAKLDPGYVQQLEKANPGFCP